MTRRFLLHPFFANRAAFAAASLVFCLFATPPIVRAADVLIIKDADNQIVRDAILGFKTACGCRTTEFDLSDLDAIEKALREHPDAIFTVGSKALARAAVIKHIPLIYALVAPADEPPLSSANISGVSMNISPHTYFDAMLKLFPKARRIGVIYDPANNGSYLSEAQPDAVSHQIQLVTREIDSGMAAFKALDGLRGKVDLIWMLPDQTVVNSNFVDALMLFSFTHKYPVFSFAQKFVDRGAAAALFARPAELGSQAGEVAQTILKGGRGPIRMYAEHTRLLVNPKVMENMKAPGSPEPRSRPEGVNYP